jgi:hypothetical protein
MDEGKKKQKLHEPNCLKVIKFPHDSPKILKKIKVQNSNRISEILKNKN